MVQMLSYTLASALGILLCKEGYKLFRNLREKCVQIELECNRKRYMSAMAEQYSDLKVYSICLSIDYQKNRKSKNDNKEVLNKVIYSKIENMLKAKVSEIMTKKYTDALVIASCDFGSYDRVYNNIMKILSKVQKEILQRYQLTLIPSITTDAHTRADVYEIKQNHNNIKHCNFANKACATKVFSKKYELTNNHKFKSTPVGEYSIIDSNTEKTYNLDMINGNLSLALK